MNMIANLFLERFNKNVLFLFVISLRFVFPNQSYCQILYSSNLPIIIVNSTASYIPDEPKVPASFQIIDNGVGVLNNINDIPNHYNGFCGIETRGNSTQGFDKKMLIS